MPPHSAQRLDPLAELAVNAESICLVLWWFNESPFSLFIPVDHIAELTLKPIKFLHYLAWAVLGLDGHISTERDSDEAEDEESLGPLTGGTIYHYVFPSGATLQSAVDVDLIIKSRTTSTQELRESSFRQKVDLRDGRSAILQVPASNPVVEVAHIIPFNRGTQHILNIVSTRPIYSRNETANDINDVRNGILLDSTLHVAFDLHHIVLLKLPNHVLGVEDIPSRNDKDFAEKKSRYVFQWLEHGSGLKKYYGINTDIDFENGKPSNQPSPLLLDYVYGAAAVLNWGKGAVAEFKTRSGLFRPPPVSSPPMRPKKTKQKTKKSLGKRRSRGGYPSVSDAGPSGTQLGADFVDKHVTFEDAEELVMWFAARSPAAHQRLQEVENEQKERDARIKAWTENVSVQ